MNAKLEETFERTLVDVDPNDVQNNLFAIGRYPVTLDDEFVASLERDGLLQPPGIYRNSEGKLEAIFGHKRIAGLKRLGQRSVRMYLYGNLTERDVKRLVIASNLYRPITNEQRLRDFADLKALEDEESPARMQRGKRIADGEKRGSATTLAAKAAGVSPATGRLGSAVLGEIDAAEKAGDTAKASELRSTLNNEGVRPAHRAAFPESNGKSTNGSKSKRPLGTDKAGNPVPPRLVPIFKAIAEFNAAIAKKSSLKADVRKLAKTPAGACIDLQSFERQLDTAGRIFSLSIPVAVCLECQGGGCTFCDSRGWLSQRDRRTEVAESETAEAEA
jgi:ParB-like chromosome segregation protein Spo0J